MKGWGAVCLGVGALALACLGWGGVRVHNQLVEFEVAVDSQWSQVENQLERQHDLIPKLLTLTRAYAEHERGVFEKLADARSRYLQAPPGQKPSEARSVDMAFAEVLLVAERYPDLKADQQFRDLSYEIAGTQNRIALERKRFNDLVALHNARIRQVPWRLLAVDMEARAFYAPPEGGLSDPKVSL